MREKNEFTKVNETPITSTTTKKVIFSEIEATIKAIPYDTNSSYEYEAPLVDDMKEENDFSESNLMSCSDNIVEENLLPAKKVKVSDDVVDACENRIDELSNINENIKAGDKNELVIDFIDKPEQKPKQADTKDFVRINVLDFGNKKGIKFQV